MDNKSIEIVRNYNVDPLDKSDKMPELPSIESMPVPTLYSHVELTYSGSTMI